MNLLTVAGGIVAIGAAIALACALIYLAVLYLMYAVERIEHRGERRGMQWAQNKLRSASWWFSEDPPTRALLADLAELSEWDARDKWHKARATPSVK